jgi:hypothetical protein
MEEMDKHQKLALVRNFLISPLWTEIMKPTFLLQINAKNKALIFSKKPEDDLQLKADIRALANFLDFERLFTEWLVLAEQELQQEKQYLEGLGMASGSPYQDPSQQVML